MVGQPCLAPAVRGKLAAGCTVAPAPDRGGETTRSPPLNSFIGADHTLASPSPGNTWVTRGSPVSRSAHARCRPAIRSGRHAAQRRSFDSCHALVVAASITFVAAGTD